ncbi:MAG: DMT family transporter [Proteobacteria bacterium]|nr:DMT family transporter [Pseudomonadota bacterium]MDA1058040.1 DMT family transporter [Pseudomonadota bacterium]
MNGRKVVTFLLNPYVLLTLVMLAGAGNTVVARATVGEMPPLALSFWRWVTAFVILFPIGARALFVQRHVLLAQWRIVVALGAIAVAAFNSLIYLGVQHTTALNASLVLSVIPVVTVALSWILLRERANLRMVVGLAAGLIGVLVIIARGDISLLVSLDFNGGDLLVFASVFCWAGYSILLGRLPPGIRPEGLLLAMVMVGLVLLAPFYLWEAAAGARMVLSAPNMLGVFYMGAFSSVFSYILWNRCVGIVGANVASQFTYLNPAFGGSLAVLLLGESLRPYHAGVLLIFLGIYLATTARRAVPKTARVDEP